MSDRSNSRHSPLSKVLPDVPVVEMTYVRRAKADADALRQAFHEEDRKAFLSYLLTEKSTDLRARGFTERNLESLRRGKVPHGYNVHHIRPLDDGGDNRFDNLVLLPARPQHEAIHRYLDPQLKGLERGEARRVNLPMIEAGAYAQPQREVDPRRLRYLAQLGR
jgi:hypothetical protein